MIRCQTLKANLNNSHTTTTLDIVGREKGQTHNNSHALTLTHKRLALLETEHGRLELAYSNDGPSTHGLDWQRHMLLIGLHFVARMCTLPHEENLNRILLYLLKKLLTTNTLT